MTDSFLDNAGGYTPVPDKLVREYDFTTAYAWGKVWRYCRMANGTCTASHETIAKRAGMSRRSLIEKLNVLIEAGYIEDLTPNLKNKPHTYCTKKGEEKILSAMQISHTESDNPTEDNEDSTLDTEMGMRIPHSDSAENAQPDTPTMQNLHGTYAEFAQPTMQNLHLKKDSLETLQETKESSPNGEGADKPPPLREIRPKSEQELPEVEKPPPKVEYTPFQRDFLAYFNAKRFKNPTQFNTIASLTEQYGETELKALAEWAANKGMGLGQAIPAIKSALTNPKRHKNGASDNGKYQRTSRSSNQPPTSQATGLGEWTPEDLAEFREAGIPFADDG